MSGVALGGVWTLKGRYQSVYCDGRGEHLQMYITGRIWAIRLGVEATIQGVYTWEIMGVTYN